MTKLGKKSNTVWWIFSPKGAGVPPKSAKSIFRLGWERADLLFLMKPLLLRNKIKILQ